MTTLADELLPEAAWRPFREAFAIADGVAYLNHGSFGPPPQSVVAARRAFQGELDANPMNFFLRRREPLLDEARAVLGRFIGAQPANLTFVANATTAMNLVAAGFALGPVDEVLLNDHEYGAVFRIWRARCSATGARIVMPSLPYPPATREEIVAAIFAAVTPRTRLIVISHVTSPTAVIMPIAEVCRRASAAGIAVCIDGPHAVAMCDFDLEALDCDFYCASCHKWLSAPFGSGFLYVHPRRQATIEPLVRSWGKRTSPEVAGTWTDELRWSGTNDPSAYLAIPAAIRFMEEVGLERFRRHTHALAREARRRIESLTGLPAFVPDDASWYGSMIALPLPPGDGPALQQALWDRHRIEILIVDWNGRRYVRPSFHLYNRIEDLERLVGALEIELADERRSPTN